MRLVNYENNISIGKKYIKNSFKNCGVYIEFENGIHIQIGDIHTNLIDLFKNNINSYLEQNDVRKLDNEQLFVRRKIDELTKEIKQLENNISFISNASKDNPLIKNVYNNIENYNKDLNVWKKKI